MTDSSEDLHEERGDLETATVDWHRAIVSLREELEAVDWYNQRVDATADASLRAILAHNRDEEKEHAAMLLEWLRRRDPVFDGMLKDYLFSQGEITDLEAGGGDMEAASETPAGGSLAIGSLKGGAGDE